MISRFLMFATVVLLCASPLHGELVITDSLPGTFVDISVFGIATGLSDDGVVEVWPELDLTQTMFDGGDGRVWIANNGALGFVADGSSGAFSLNGPLPSFALFGGAHGTPQALAAYWDDLDADTGDVYYRTTVIPEGRRFSSSGINVRISPVTRSSMETKLRCKCRFSKVMESSRHSFFTKMWIFRILHWTTERPPPSGIRRAAPAMTFNGHSTSPNSVGAGTVLTLLELPGSCTNKGDGNGDCHIDNTDLIQFEVCMAGPQTPHISGCECYDFHTDGFVDLFDFAEFQLSFTGPTDTIPDCVPE